MLIAGILWGSRPKNDNLISKLNSIAKRHIKADLIHIDKFGLNMVSGKVSQNDFDEIIEGDNRLTVGRVLENGTNQPLKTESLSRMNLNKIMREYWGKYILISNNRESKSATILRDPTGQLPLFYWALPQGGVLFSSEIEIIAQFQGRQLEPNWSFLASYLLHNNESTSEKTAFENINELPPGCALNYHNDCLDMEPVYRPIDSCPDHAVTDESLIHTLESSMQAWCKPYRNILLSLSGGLDSTSLLYCLKNIMSSGQTLTAINLFHGGVKTSNEVAYAQKPCDELGVELLKVDMAKYMPFTPPAEKLSIKPNAPYPSLSHLSYLEHQTKLINNKPDTLFVSGHGGDHIFLAPPLKSLVIDCFLDKGLKSSLQKLQEVSNFYRTSILQIIKSNLIDFYRNKSLKLRKSVSTNESSWITKDLARLGEENFVHPMFSKLPLLSRVGKFQHMEALDNAVASIAMELGDHNPVFFPLLYQPAFEQALSIPTYDLLQQGFDRFPFRYAISKAYNTDKVWRRNKGETSGIIQLGLRQNISYIKQLCLEGQFAKAGLIDRGYLEKHLNAVAGGELLNMWSLMNLISCEIFFEQWQS